ncbi:MAG: DNA repair protein RecO [Actinobacteria bacterium]|nr:DNA repair protein RecO [Actinomycetota bacterium]
MARFQTRASLRRHQGVPGPRPSLRRRRRAVTLYRDKGVVIRTWRLGEADRIVVLLTPEHGKVRAVAKGVRKTRSKFGGRLEPTSHVDLQLYAGRGDLGIVTQAETIDRFENVRADPDRFSEASALLEVVDVVSPDGDPDRQRYEMLLGALRTLDENPTPLLVPAFFLKLLAREGLAPHLDSCVRCGSSGPLVAVEFGEGGTLCGSCRRGRPVSDAALAVMRAVLGGGLVDALAVVDPEVCTEVDGTATAAIEYHLERRIKSRRVMERA